MTYDHDGMVWFLRFQYKYLAFHSAMLLRIKQLSTRSNGYQVFIIKAGSQPCVSNL